MAYRRHALEAGGHDEGLVGEPLLESTWSPPRAYETPSSIDSMPWSYRKAVWSGSTTVTTSSDDGTELALESLGNSQDLDSTNLRAQGHEAALKRSFSLLSALGLGFSSWVGYLSNFGQNLIYGGPRVVVFGLLIATVVQCVITLGLSEVASAFPSAGVSLSSPSDGRLDQNTTAGAIPLYLHLGPWAPQEVCSVCRGLDDSAWLVDCYFFRDFPVRCLRRWFGQLLG
ncbi:MAG: hypothetical protein Q9193_005306 [Seirophora villosa]